MGGVKWHAGKPAAWIEVTGEDAFSFLQGQFSNDLRGETGLCAYGLWLNRKGKVLADSFVWRAGEERCFLLSTHSPASVIIDRLESHIIADDVEVADRTAEVELISLWGEGAADLIKRAGLSAPLPGRAVPCGQTVVFPGRRSRLGGVELVVHEENAAAAAGEWEQTFAGLGAEQADADEMEAERVRARIPAVPGDIGPEDLPQEGGLEADAISYQKGCYLGQEVMARLRAMGNPRRSLVPVRVEAREAPAPGTPFYDGAKVVGTLRSLAGRGPWEGLAMAHRDATAKAREFSLEPGGSPAVFVTGSS